MTRQEIFDQVVEHFTKDPRRSTKNGGRIGCKYRGFDGTKCAVGCLITDEEYDPAMEDMALSTLVCDGWLPKRLLPVRNWEFLRDLQKCHDLAAVTYNFEAKFWNDMRELAKDYRIDASGVPE